MMLVNENMSRSLLDMDDAIDAVSDAFLALHRGDAEVFPVAYGKGGAEDSSFSMKGGRIAGPGGAVGLKVGSFWPTNRLTGLPSHASTVLLLDPDTGLLRAVVETGYLNALRTAAADAVAVRHLARNDAETLGVVGAGHQAWFECLGVTRVRAIRSVRIWSRAAARAEAFAARLRFELDVDAVAAPIEEVAESDIVVTATPSTAPLIRPEWLLPGTHVSAMGADAPGNRELGRPYPAAAHLFADLAEQSRLIGEFQGLDDPIAGIGAVIAGDMPGRTSDDQITLFDSSGLAIQDLAIASKVLEKLGRV